MSVRDDRAPQREPAAGATVGEDDAVRDDAAGLIDDAGATDEAGAAEVAEISLARRVFNVRTAVSFLIAFGIIALVVSRLNVDVSRIAEVARTANPLLLLAALLVYYLAFPIRGMRWHLMLDNAGVRRGMLPGLAGISEIIFLSWFVNCLVPAKLGDIYRAYLIRKHSGVSLSKAGGTIVAERLTDFAVALSMLGGAGLFAFNGRLPADVLLAIEIGSAMILVAGLGLLFMWTFDRHLERLIPTRFQDVYRRFHEGALGSFGQYPRLLALTICAWLPEALRFFLVASAMGVVLAPDLPHGLAVAVFISLGSAFLTALPLTPAGLGFAESAITIFLGFIGVDPQVAFTVALLDRTISYWSLIGFGLLLYPFARRK